MMIWQKSLENNKQIGIDNVLEYSYSGDLEDNHFEVCAFHPDLQTGNDSGWVYVGCTGGTWRGCVEYLYKKNLIDKHEYNEIEGLYS